MGDVTRVQGQFTFGRICVNDSKDNQSGDLRTMSAGSCEGERLPSVVPLGQESPEIDGFAFIQDVVLGHLGPPQVGGQPIQILWFASQEQKTMINTQENSRTERQQYLEKLDVTHPGMCPWAETEEKTWNELQEALEMLKVAELMCRRIQRIELENSNLILTTEKQAKEMEALREKLLSAGGINEVEEAPKGDSGKTRVDIAARWSQAELTKLTSELSKMRMQDDSYKMEVEKYKQLYLKELRNYPCNDEWTCKCPEGSSANLEEEGRWNTSAVVGLEGLHPECPQVAYLTSSSMESQGNGTHTSQSQEASSEFMKNPKSWYEAKEKVRIKLNNSVHSLLCALCQETKRTKVLQRELAGVKKTLHMPQKEGHRCDSRKHKFHEVSKVSRAEMNVPAAVLRPEGETAEEENPVGVQENPGTTVLTQMEFEMKDMESAISEMNGQEYQVKKELQALKQLYRGELERIDGMALELSG